MHRRVIKFITHSSGQDMQDARLIGLQQGEVIKRWHREPARPTAAAWAIIGAVVVIVIAGVALAENAWTAHNAARLDVEFGR